MLWRGDPGKPESRSTVPREPVGGSPSFLSPAAGVGMGKRAKGRGTQGCRVSSPVISSNIGWWCRLAGGLGRDSGMSCGFLMMCPMSLWLADVWLDRGPGPEKGSQRPVECAGSSQPRCLPESRPGWPCLGRCQAPSPTRSARWVGPFGGRSGLPDTSPHSDSGAGPWGGSGAWPGEPPWEVTAGSGGCFAVGRVCLCLSVRVFGAGLQSGPASLHPHLRCLLLPRCRCPARRILSPAPVSVPPHQGRLLLTALGTVLPSCPGPVLSNAFTQHPLSQSPTVPCRPLDAKSKT